MRIVLQRVKSAAVRVSGETVGCIGQGILLFLGIHSNDTADQVRFLASKCLDLRLFEDDQGKMNRSVKEIGGHVLVVSQFTLYGDCRKGRRPSFSDAAPPEQAKPLYEQFVNEVRLQIPGAAAGVFGAVMEVELLNDGPVTFLLEK